MKHWIAKQKIDSGSLHPGTAQTTVTFWMRMIFRRFFIGYSNAVDALACPLAIHNRMLRHHMASPTIARTERSFADSTDETEHTKKLNVHYSQQQHYSQQHPEARDQ